MPKEYIPGVAKGLESIMGSGILAGFPVIGCKVMNRRDIRRDRTADDRETQALPLSRVCAPSPPSPWQATLVDGAFHDVDSSVMAFEIAGKAAARKGLRAAGAKLMEPLMKVEVTTPEESMGDVIGDINSRRGMIGELAERGNMKVVRAKVPLANMFQYVSSLRSMSKGRASYSMELEDYEQVPPNVEKEIMSKYKGNSGDDE